MKALVLFISFLLLLSCSQEKAALRLVSTTSVQNSGLLDLLADDFYAKEGIPIEYFAVGSGKAIDMARRGEGDVLIAHSPRDEEALVREGVSLGRQALFYNYFILVGEERVSGPAPEVLETIRKGLFISRGDRSGTHRRELALWEGRLPRNYLETGRGMVETLRVSYELRAYTLVDEAVFYVNQKKIPRELVLTGEEELKNVYSVHLINPQVGDSINQEGARLFQSYLWQEETRQMIAAFGQEDYGRPLYRLVNLPS